MSQIEIRVYQRESGTLQASIEEVWPDGTAHGYRLAGPKFDGAESELRLRAVLTERDAAEISGFLAKVPRGFSTEEQQPMSDLREAIEKLHTPVDETAEIWADGVGQELHAERFPDCDPADCEGHEIEIQTCSECGYMHDGDTALYRSWPCPTITAWLAEPSQAEIEAAAKAICTRRAHLTTPPTPCYFCTCFAEVALSASRRVLGYPQTEDVGEDQDGQGSDW